MQSPRLCPGSVLVCACNPHGCVLAPCISCLACRVQDSRPWEGVALAPACHVQASKPREGVAIATACTGMLGMQRAIQQALGGCCHCAGLHRHAGCKPADHGRVLHSRRLSPASSVASQHAMGGCCPCVDLHRPPSYFSCRCRHLELDVSSKGAAGATAKGVALPQSVGQLAPCVLFLGLRVCP